LLGYGDGQAMEKKVAAGNRLNIPRGGSGDPNVGQGHYCPSPAPASTTAGRFGSWNEGGKLF